MPTRSDDLSGRLRELVRGGVEIADPRTTYVGPEVDLARIRKGAILHPGARIEGAKTLLLEGAEVGRCGPAVVRDSALGRDARVDSGCVEGAVLLHGACVGPAAHVRPVALLEEEASTAHCVGLKHTILLSFVTVGSLVNLCDILVAGGTSRRDHSEVGSGFIHFNFTPWGARGDKATPTLVGDVVHGVFARSPRIFLGGLSGIVGPGVVGYGAVTGAGQVIRSEVPAHTVFLEPAPRLREPVRGAAGRPHPVKTRRNAAYVAQLVALRAFYRHVRLARAQGDEAALVEAALSLLDAAVRERLARLESYVRGFTEDAFRWDPLCEVPPCPLPLASGPPAHVPWIRSLSDRDVEAGVQWLGEVARRAEATLPRLPWE